MSRTRVRRRRAMVLLLIAVCVTALLTWLGGPAGAGQRGRPAGSYTVRTHDTLWRIAERVGPDGADVRAVVDAIADANDVDAGSLEPGQVLRIPADLG